MTDQSNAVTVVISRRVKPGFENDFESVSAAMSLAASGFDGYLGTTMLKPISDADPEYRIVFRFRDQGCLDQWNKSESRLSLLSEIEPLITEQRREEHYEGIAAWFTPPAVSKVAHPNKLRMTLVSWLALYPTVTVIFVLLAPQLESFPLAVRTFVITGIVMFLMSYVLMPRFTRWFRNWIFA